MSNTVETDLQLDFGFQVEEVSVLKPASEALTDVYLKEVYAKDIPDDEWKDILSRFPSYAPTIHLFRDALGIAWERQANAHENDPRNQYIDQIRREPKQRDSFEGPNATQSAIDNLALVEDLLWIRSPNYYTSWEVSDELDEIYGEATHVLIFENPDDAGDVEHPSMAYIPMENLMEKILTGEIGLKPSFAELKA